MKRSVLDEISPSSSASSSAGQKPATVRRNFLRPLDGFRIQASIGCATSIKLPLYRDWVVRDRSFPPRYIGWR